MDRRFLQKKIDWLNIIIWIIGILIFLFMLLPSIIITISAFSASKYSTFPPQGLSLRWFVEVFTNKEWKTAIKNSLLLVVVVTPITTILGTMAAYALNRLHLKWGAQIQSFLVSPLMIPQIIIGISLLYMFAALGLNGSFTALVIGQVLVAFPYVVRNVNASIVSVPNVLEYAAMSLGASPMHTFFSVVFPLIKNGIFSGAIFAAVVSIGEVSVSLLLSAPKNTPVSVRIFNYVEQTYDPSVNAVSVIFIAISIILLFILKRKQ